MTKNEDKTFHMFLVHCQQRNNNRYTKQVIYTFRIRRLGIQPAKIFSLSHTVLQNQIILVANTKRSERCCTEKKSDFWLPFQQSTISLLLNTSCPIREVITLQLTIVPLSSLVTIIFLHLACFTHLIS